MAKKKAPAPKAEQQSHALKARKKSTSPIDFLSITPGRWTVAVSDDPENPIRLYTFTIEALLSPTDARAEWFDFEVEVQQPSDGGRFENAAVIISGEAKTGNKWTATILASSTLSTPIVVTVSIRKPSQTVPVYPKFPIATV